jgi:hypothetical protein
MPGDLSSMRGCLSQISKIVAESDAIASDYLGLIAQIVSRANSSEFSSVLSALGDRTEYHDGQKSQYLNDTTQNLHWSDFPTDFIPWLVFALEVNFKDFLSSGIGIFGKDADPAKAAEARKLLASLAK